MRFISKKIYRIAPLYFLCVLLTLTGCSKLNFLSSGSGKIGVNVSFGNTKGSEITTANISEFAMECWLDDDYVEYDGGPTITERKYFGPVKVSKSSSTWSFETDQYWINDIPMRFWSYAPKTTKGTRTITSSSLSGKNEIAFTYSNTTTSVSNLEDLIFAYNKENRVFDEEGNITSGSGSGSDETVDIKFYHALAQIRFAVSPDDGTFDTSSASGYEIVSVEVDGAPTSGSCTFNGDDAKTAVRAPYGFTWSGQSGTSAFANNCGNYTSPINWSSKTFKTVSNENKTLYTTKDVFFVIPKSGVKNLKVTFKPKAGGSNTSKTVTVSDDWKAGEYYTYKINTTAVPSGPELSLSLTVGPWDDDEAPVNICEYNVSSPFSWTCGLVDDTEKRVVVENGLPVTGTFNMTEPVGAQLLISLDGNVDAFEVSNPTPIIDGNPITVTVTPKISDPKKVYETSLHIYLILPDNSAVQLDDVIFGTGSSSNRYKIILPSN